MVVFFVGPSSGKVTGQSVAFNLIYKNFSGKKYLVDYPDFTDEKFNTLLKYLQSVFTFIFRNIFHLTDSKVVYITTSRTFSGFFRDLFFILIGKLFRARIINHLHGSDFIYFRDSKSKPVQKIIDFVYSKINISIVLTESMKEQYERYAIMKIFVVANCYSGLSGCETKQILQKSEIQFVYLSNLMYSKGVLHLIKAVKEAHNAGLKVKLKLAGALLSDEYYSDNELNKLITDELKACDYIEYVGIVLGQEKNDLLLNSDVFILPTFYRSEAQPISIIESMYYGCVIVTTDHNYIKDFVSDRNGLIIEKDSQRAIYDAIKEIDSERKYFIDISERNMKLARSYFSPEIYIQKISNIINKNNKNQINHIQE